MKARIGVLLLLYLARKLMAAQAVQTERCPPPPPLRVVVQESCTYLSGVTLQKKGAVGISRKGTFCIDCDLDLGDRVLVICADTITGGENVTLTAKRVALIAYKCTFQGTIKGQHEIIKLVDQKPDTSKVALKRAATSPSRGLAAWRKLKTSVLSLAVR